MAKRLGTVIFYRDDAGEYRWRIRAANGNILGDSGEGYKRRADCVKAANLVLFEAASWPFVGEVTAASARRR